MSQQPPKKSGSRDINDLKARLGLKKGTQPNPTVGAKTGPAPALLPPPGLAVPPPPGAVPPTPAGPPQPVVPNAADDPFGAMNAMAQIGAAQRAPEIVIVNDGKPVENVSAGTRAAGIAKWAAIALVPFIVGVMIRGVSKDAHYYNAGITEAKGILTEVRVVKKQLVDLNELLSKTKKMKDKDVQDALEKLDIESRLTFQNKQTGMNRELLAGLNRFYAQASAIRIMLADHLAAAKQDEKALGDARAATEKLTAPPELAAFLQSPVRMGVLVWNPEKATGDAFGARLVEIGPPFCAGETVASRSGTCANGIDGYGYRTKPGDQWARADFAVGLAGGAAVPAGKILPISMTEVFDGLARTNEGTAAEALYNKRLATVRKALGEAIEAGNDLEGKLRAKTNESKRFTFFMP